MLSAFLRQLFLQLIRQFPLIHYTFSTFCWKVVKRLTRLSGRVNNRVPFKSYILSWQKCLSKFAVQKSVVESLLLYANLLNTSVEQFLAGLKSTAIFRVVVLSKLPVTSKCISNFCLYLNYVDNNNRKQVARAKVVKGLCRFPKSFCISCMSQLRCSNITFTPDVMFKEITKLNKIQK